MTRYWLSWVKMVEILPLAEGVVEGVVDGLRQDAEAGGGVAVDGELLLQAGRRASRW